MSVPSDNALENLKDGIRRFQEEVYPENSAAYHLAATTPQKPHTLIITCADSRIDIETITSSQPGEVFVTRNVGNMVPPYGEMLGGVSAVIEYAVDALKVKHAVVCGHMDCGAMKALLQPDTGLESMPTVKAWLRNAAAARSVAHSMDHGDLTVRRLTEQNVLLQLTHLQTHPSIRGAMARNALTISGWIYDIASGDVLIYDPAKEGFASVRDSSQVDPVSDPAAQTA